MAACPAQAISGAHFSNDQIFAEIEGVLWDAMPGTARPQAPKPRGLRVVRRSRAMSDEQFEPKIVGFLCNWCSYRAADLAGTARIDVRARTCASSA